MSFPTFFTRSPRMSMLATAILKFGSATSVMRKPTKVLREETSADLSSTSFNAF